MRIANRALDQLLRQQIRAHPALAADAALLTLMPGCGPILTGFASIAKDSSLREHRRVLS